MKKIILVLSTLPVLFNCCSLAQSDDYLKLSVDSVHKTPAEKQLYLSYKKLFEDQVFDSTSCYVTHRFLGACVPGTKKPCKQIVEYKIDNILINKTKDSIAIIVAFRTAFTNDNNDKLEEEMTNCSLMKAVVNGDKLEFVCTPNNVWITVDGDRIDWILKKFKNLMINGGGYYIDGKRNERFLYQLFNESDSVLMNI